MKNLQRPVRPTSRQGVTLQPALDVANETNESSVESPAEDVVLVSAVERTPDVTPVISTDREEIKNDWPDPLEMPDFHTESTEQVAASPALDVSEDEQGDDELFTIDEPTEADAEPLSSPFIADAKVEKRPLGGAVVDEPSEELSRTPVLGALTTDDVSISDPADQLPVTPEDIEPQLPPELQSDLMAIETDGGTSAAKPIAEANNTQETVVASPEVVPAPVAQPVPSPAPVNQPAVSTGPTSIPQQYQEEPSTSDVSNGSIYDTESYHQPLAHPTKAKSGWLWVIWILLLLIVGGGGAVALYFLGII
jgi:hypothetical protein